MAFFDPSKGGDPVLFQHFFWFYSHPVVYVMILPAMGIISEVIPVFSRKPIFGYTAIAYSSLAIAFIGFLVWGHHMFTSGMSPWANAFFSFLTFFVAVPTAVKVFNWIATLYKGSITFESPMLYALTFIFLFVIGGLTGPFLGALATNVQLHDTYFVVAHFHYTMMGGTVMGFFAGHPLLVPEDDRPDAEREARPDRVGADLHRLQRHLLHDVHRRRARHAPPLRGIPPEVPPGQRDRHDRLLHPGGRAR